MLHQREACTHAAAPTRSLSFRARAGGQVDPRVGGRFEIFGGAVRATFTELSAQRIALDWHFNSWREGVVSKVRARMFVRACMFDGECGDCLRFQGVGIVHRWPAVCTSCWPWRCAAAGGLAPARLTCVSASTRALCMPGCACRCLAAHAGHNHAGGDEPGLDRAEAAAQRHPPGGQVWRGRGRDHAQRLAPADPAQDTRRVWLRPLTAPACGRGACGVHLGLQRRCASHELEQGEAKLV